MQHHKQAQVQAGAKAAQRPARMSAWMGAGMLIVMAAGWAVAARAETMIVAHGISTFGKLKYPADFKHLDYVNPEAPKGGEISEWAPGTFDSMNPYSVKGVSAALAKIDEACK